MTTIGRCFKSEVTDVNILRNTNVESFLDISRETCYNCHRTFGLGMFNARDLVTCKHTVSDVSEINRFHAAIIWMGAWITQDSDDLAHLC